LSGVLAWQMLQEHQLHFIQPKKKKKKSEYVQLPSFNESPSSRWTTDGYLSSLERTAMLDLPRIP
jgi:hypothetical protein